MTNDVNNILGGKPRLKPEDTFIFSCHSKVACFNACCADIRIILTPYDIVRLKNELKISSGEFLEKYAVFDDPKPGHLPTVTLKMSDDGIRPCVFVTENGCGVYEHRPWACRMYPLGLASSGVSQEFYFLLQEEGCEGFKAHSALTVKEWVLGQGAAPYQKEGALFMQITIHPMLSTVLKSMPGQAEMLKMVLYDIDRFRKFIFKSSFLKTFEVAPQTVNKIEKDDIELLNFGYEWLRFSLFKEGGLKINKMVLENRKKT